jgi:hypothetical protein
MGLRGGPPMDFLRGGTPKSKDPRGTLRRLWTYLERQRWVLILDRFRSDRHICP